MALVLLYGHQCHMRGWPFTIWTIWSCMMDPDGPQMVTDQMMDQMVLHDGHGGNIMDGIAIRWTRWSCMMATSFPMVSLQDSYKKDSLFLYVSPIPHP